jgi:hypothetical protein
LRERAYLEDLVVDGRIILKRIIGRMEWTDMDQNRGRWRALVKAVK